MPSRLITFIMILSFSLLSYGQNSSYHTYINRHKHLALEQMFKYGIPASITLAQGLLESGAGQSTLARKANNHFGIKAHNSWTGPYVLRDDDAPNERFRAYRNVRESYEDHSLFLSRNTRYAALFRLGRKDYKGWARGLKRAGYATNPRYADQLISIIEAYSLHKYDRLKHLSDLGRYSHDELSAGGAAQELERGVLRCNGNYYIIARPGDSLKAIAEWSGVSKRRLRRYNELPKGVEPAAGDVIYLEKKRSKASRKLKGHVHYVAAGESMHSISQRYGVRMKTLYKLNNLPEYSAVSAGDLLRIR